VETRLTGQILDDCVHDPVLATKLILGYDCPPHMELRLWGMWSSTYFLDHSGGGTGKTLCLAIIALLRALLMRGRTEGIVSKTFRQGKILGRQYFDVWTDRCPLVKREFAGALHGQDEYEYRFHNGSSIRIIPPGFSAEAEGAFSEDWTDGYFDEFTRYGHPAAVDRVLIGRVRRPVDAAYDARNPLFGHHFCFLGTAGYTWHPAFRRVKQFLERTKAGDPRWQIQSWNVTDIPDDWERLKNREATEIRAGSMTDDELLTEVLGLWVSDSLGWYSMRSVENCRSSACPILLRA
jgi:hypothetical protein